MKCNLTREEIENEEMGIVRSTINIFEDVFKDINENFNSEDFLEENMSVTKETVLNTLNLFGLHITLVKKELEYVKKNIKKDNVESFGIENAVDLLRVMRDVTSMKFEMLKKFEIYIDKYPNEDIKKIIFNEDNFRNTESETNKEFLMCDVFIDFLTDYISGVLSEKDIKKLKILIEINKDRVIPESLVKKIFNSYPDSMIVLFSQYNSFRNESIFIENKKKEQSIPKKIVKPTIIKYDKPVEKLNIAKVDLPVDNEIAVFEENIVYLSQSLAIHEMMVQEIDCGIIKTIMPLEEDKNYYQVFTEVRKLLNEEKNTCNEILNLSDTSEDIKECQILLGRISLNKDFIDDYYNVDSRKEDVDKKVFVKHQKEV